MNPEMPVKAEPSKTHADLQGMGTESIIYAKRFTSLEGQARDITWQVLCREFFQKFISSDSVIVDVGAGDGLFIQHIIGRRRIAVDINKHAAHLRGKGIEVLQMPATEFAKHLDEKADAIFWSICRPSGT